MTAKHRSDLIPLSNSRSDSSVPISNDPLETTQWVNSPTAATDQSPPRSEALVASTSFGTQAAGSLTFRPSHPALVLGETATVSQHAPVITPHELSDLVEITPWVNLRAGIANSTPTGSQAPELRQSEPVQTEDHLARQQDCADRMISTNQAANTGPGTSQLGPIQAEAYRSDSSRQTASDGSRVRNLSPNQCEAEDSTQQTPGRNVTQLPVGGGILTSGFQSSEFTPPAAGWFTQPSASRVNPNYHESAGQNPMVWARDSDNHQRLQFSQPQLNQLPTRSQPVGPAPPVSARGRHILGYFNPEWQNRADILTREASGRPRPRYSPYPLPPAPTILTQQAPESSRHRGAAPSSTSNSQQTYTNFSPVQVQPEVAGREGLSVFTQSRAVSPQAARCPLTRTDQRDEELEEELYHHTWSARDQAPDTLTDHALNSCEVFKRDLDKINAQLQLVESRFHKANSCATDINRMIEETKMTPFTDRIANARIRDIGKIRLPMYEGNSDPRTYIISFRLAMARAPLSEEEEEAGYCRLFSESLTGAALEWFGRLKENSINSFSELVYAFVRQYSMFIENNVSLSDL